MAIRFQCEHCAARVKVPEGSQGRPVRCPRCGHMQRVPKHSQIDDSDNTTAANQSPSQADPQAPAQPPGAVSDPAAPVDAPVAQPPVTQGPLAEAAAPQWVQAAASATAMHEQNADEDADDHDPAAHAIDDAIHRAARDDGPADDTDTVRDDADPSHPRLFELAVGEAAEALFDALNLPPADASTVAPTEPASAEPSVVPVPARPLAPVEEAALPSPSAAAPAEQQEPGAPSPPLAVSERPRPVQVNPPQPIPLSGPAHRGHPMIDASAPLSHSSESAASSSQPCAKLAAQASGEYPALPTAPASDDLGDTGPTGYRTLYLLAQLLRFAAIFLAAGGILATFETLRVTASWIYCLVALFLGSVLALATWTLAEIAEAVADMADRRG